ncbi:hypothetical protein OS493_004788 [Desmophyllum pertusum]|uniref:Uncharacterized protein n=1 Tax=Desmophyllum pertusum TaxID=174260 RepID=A0A9W9ZIE5_9CNID|nr:hypothetical protein OS493_004788 [Desmophyllum pertusum]
MAVSVCGPHGQRAVRRVGLVPSLEAESVIALSLLMEDKTALGTPVMGKVASLRHVLVLSMEGGQRIHLGAHAQSQPTVFKASRNEPEPVPILPR